MKTALPLLLAVSFVGVTLAGADAPPVTEMGRNLLPRTDLIVRGEPGRPARLGSGTILIGFSVKEVLEGDRAPDRILVLTSDPDYFPVGAPPCVLFLTRLGSSRYEPLARVEIADRDGPHRLAALRRYLEIERLPSLEKKVVALHDCLIENLFSNEHFLVWSSARELVPFTAKHPSAFTKEEFEAILGALSDTRDDTLKELLEATVENLRHLRAPAKEDEPEPDQPNVPRTLPPPREFKELENAWNSPGLKADEREMIVTTVAARHLKHGFSVLLSALSDEVPAIRVTAARNLGETLSPRAERPLLELVATEKNLLVLEGAVQSLGVLQSEKALPIIESLSAVPALLRACAFAAARIGGPPGEEFLTGLRAQHSSEDPADQKVRGLIDFLRSDTFKRQEAALQKVRRQRLR